MRGSGRPSNHSEMPFRWDLVALTDCRRSGQNLGRLRTRDGSRPGLLATQRRDSLPFSGSSRPKVVDCVHERKKMRDSKRISPCNRFARLVDIQPATRNCVDTRRSCPAAERQARKNRKEWNLTAVLTLGHSLRRRRVRFDSPCSLTRLDGMWRNPPSNSLDRSRLIAGNLSPAISPNRGRSRLLPDDDLRQQATGQGH